jgi:hypothetical protein
VKMGVSVDDISHATNQKIELLSEKDAGVIFSTAPPKSSLIGCGAF